MSFVAGSGLTGDKQGFATREDTMIASERTTDATGTGNYADINGLHLYHETHGTGRPLILLHGGLENGAMFEPVLPILTQDHQVITVDLQGHGRTADIDRPLDIRLMADDIAALIRRLGLEKPDVVGYSLGGGVALFTASKYPELVGKLVVVSAHAWRDAVYPEMLAQQAQVGAATAEILKGTPIYDGYMAVAPRPEDFPRLLDKIGEGLAQPFDYRDVVRGLQVPTMIACADADMAPPSHYVEVFTLLDGGQRDGGWQGEGRPKGGHALAVIPGRTHYDVFLSPVLAEATVAFLDAGRQ
jgi:pimeloyl-ACP methyl ester carboxylesterase